MLAPSVPPAPPRLSMMSCLPVSLANWADSGRAKASVPPPAGNGTIIVTGLVGQPTGRAARRTVWRRRRRRPRAAVDAVEN
jgi:hypothetical protein